MTREESLINELRHVAFEDGESIERRQAELIALFIIGREKLLLEKIGNLTNAISAIQMLIEEDIEERNGFTFNRKKMLDIAEEALK
jgi:hypothetical protein